MSKCETKRERERVMTDLRARERRLTPYLVAQVRRLSFNMRVTSFGADQRRDAFAFATNVNEHALHAFLRSARYSGCVEVSVDELESAT